MAHDDQQQGFDPKTPVVGELTPTDATLALVTAITAALPIVGGPIAAVTTELRRTFDRRQAARLAATVDDLRAALDRLGAHVDRDLAADPTFAAFVEAALESSSQARHAEKRRYYVALVARSATDEGPSDTQRGILLDTLDRVEHTHLRLLHAVAAGPLGPRLQDYYSEGTPAFTAIRTALPGIGEVFLHRAWEDMASLGLLESWNVLISDESSHVNSSDGSVITPFGREFLAFIAPF